MTSTQRTTSPDLQNKHESPLLVYVGAPVLDISTAVNVDLLRRFDLKEDDCIKSTDAHVPLFDELLSNPDSLFTPGGSAQNTARISKWVLGQKGRVVFAGCTGEDDYAGWMKHLLHDEGVETLYLTVKDEGTGLCACLLSPGGQRSLCVRQMAAAKFDTCHLRDPQILSLLEAADCVFVAGYFLSHSPKVVEEMAERCRPSQLMSMSLSAVYVCLELTDELLRTLQTVDLLLGNEAEARALVRACRGDDQLSCAEVAQFVADLPRKADRSVSPRVVVISRGPEPVSVAFGRHDGHDAPPPFEVPVPRGVEVVDGVGCGDALAGAFLAAYLLTGGDVPAAVRAGIRAAVKIAQTAGCQQPTESFGEIA